MELEIKHLAPYLPYSLKLMVDGVKCNTAWMSTKRISYIDIAGYGEVENTRWEHASGKVKPLLRPLSDLSMEYISSRLYPNKEMFFEDVKNQTVIIKIWEELLAGHFDVYNLIPNNLAIPL